jgi:phage protein D
MQGSTFVSVKIAGSPLDEKTLGCLDSLVVENAINLPDSFTASFADPEGEVLRAISGELGKKVQIAVTHADEPGPVTILDGELTAVDVDYDAAHSGDGTRTVARGMDQSHRLHQGRKTKTWNQKTASEVATDVAQAAALDVGEVDNTSTTYEHVVQGNLTDLEFLKKLAAENDREAVVSDGKFHFRKQARAAEAPQAGTVTGTDPLQLVLKGNLLSLHATIRTSGQVKEVEVRGWDPEAKKVVKSTASAQTTAAAAGASPATLAAAAGNATYVSVSTPFAQSSETDSAAQALADHLASAFAEIEGSVDGHPRLRAGSTVSLSNVGAPIDGKYVVTSTYHRLDQRGYETSFVVSGQHDRSLLGLVAGGAAAAHEGRFPGVVPALVSDVNDPQQLGRVKLRFPWMDESYVSDWARMVQFGAGRGRGAVFLPEVDDEVLVAFEHGDPRRPYVVGGLYNGQDKPNEGDGLVDSSGVKRRGVVSKQGSLLVFFDDPTKEGIALLTSDKGLKVSLNKTKTTVHVASNGEVTIEGTTKVTIDGGQQLVLKGRQIQVGDDTTQSAEIKATQVSVSAPSIQLGSA